ncbi:hydroxypyruvate isomerase family protein [Tengunoibacter tsumagoiensis]|uniref:Hydroxypyruvate isomerase n=1 Tax=Tengunoibacter tsumagoiensis TaxID=2014871 RepID=A0A402A801_9CHLR|nr:TIM barrel protein [Tengunoibacter tsumagoiensis]GCE15297.1 hydroxypyruvate isomerase [Tengunoibacter tsumagoiensis]
MSCIRQSFCWWSFAPRYDSPQQLLHAAREIGYEGVELIDQSLWPLAKECGLTIVSTNGDFLIEQGWNRREHHLQLEQKLREIVQLAEQWAIPNIIVFSGNRQGLDDRQGAEITAEGLARAARIAEDAGVTLILELLNSKIDHQDYQCDRSAWGIEVCKMVNSPRVKLLYDIYHMQIMEGDLIRTIQGNHEYFAHYHTAGNPGRHELNEDQEIQYPPIMRTLLQTGYQGFVGQEFIPQGDPLVGLKQAYDLCDVRL